MNTDLGALAAMSRTRPVRLRIGQIIDVDRGLPLRDHDIVFDAKQIHSIGAPEGIPDATLADHTLLPCLVEAHAHMFLDGAPVNLHERERYLKQPADWMLARARSRWKKILQCGVGAIRDAGDKHGVGLALAADAKKSVGELSPTPYIDSPGAAIHHKGRYGAFMGLPIEDHPSLAACVLSRVEAGADRVKLLVSGIINFKAGEVTTPPQLSIDEVKEIVAVARRHGKQTFAHASGTEGVEHCIQGGVDTIEHGFFITREQLAKMRDRNIAWVPTFAPVQAQIDRASELGWDERVIVNLKRIIESHQNMLRKAHEMGVKILAGSDAGSCGVPHGIGLLQEMHQMEQAGLPSLAVIRSAAAEPALLRFPERIGMIRPDYRARFILARQNPLETVLNLQRARTIIFDGVAVTCAGDVTSDGL